jgi:hypothetical protein
MERELLDFLPLWAFFAATCLFSGLALEAGYRLGGRRRRSAPDHDGPVAAIVASVLALFAFLLAFTFSSAAARYEARRQAVLEEANSIGTTWLRAQMLQEPQRANSLKLLREYVDVRVTGIRGGRVEETIARSEAIQSELWKEAKAEAAARPTPVTAMYVQSLNQMIDVHSVRVQVGITNRIPVTIWVGLFAISFLGMTSVGYQAGVSGARRTPALVPLVLSFAIVMFLIADLDRPGAGYIQVNQHALTSLQASMAGN